MELTLVNSQIKIMKTSSCDGIDRHGRRRGGGGDLWKFFNIFFSPKVRLLLYFDLSSGTTFLSCVFYIFLSLTLGIKSPIYSNGKNITQHTGSLLCGPCGHRTVISFHTDCFLPPYKWHYHPNENYLTSVFANKSRCKPVSNIHTDTVYINK